MIQQMFDTIHGQRRGVGRLVLAVIGAGIALGVVGCENEDQANATISRASHLMSAINAGGGITANAPHREDVYDRVINMLRPVVSGTSGATKGAAQIITAQAMAGRGRFESVRAMRLENQCSDLISAAHNEADLFAAHSSLALALVGYDAEPEFEALREQSGQINEEIESVRTRIRGIDERIAQLTQRSEAAREEAASRHRHETELRAEAVNVGAEQRRDLIEEAVGYQREADGFEAEFVMVDAGIEQLDQTRVSVQADLDRLVTQRGLLEEAEQNTQRRMQVALDESKGADEAALEAAKRLRTVIREIEALREGELNDSYNQAESTIDNAASVLIAGARADSSRDGKDANNLNAGLIYQSLGELRTSRATGADGFIALLARLDRFALSQSDRNDYLSKRTRIETSRDESLAASKESFTLAADTFERIRGSDAMQNRLGRVVTSLRGDSSDDDIEGESDPDDTDG